MLNQTFSQQKSEIIENKAKLVRALKVLEVASKPAYTTDESSYRELIGESPEIISFTLENTGVLILPGITTPLPDPHVRNAVATIFENIHASRYVTFRVEKGWKFEMPDIGHLKPTSETPLAILLADAEKGQVDLDRLEFDEKDVESLLDDIEHPNPVYHLLCYDKSTGEIEAYARFILPTLSAPTMKREFLGRDEEEFRLLLIEELKKTRLLAFTTFVERVGSKFNIEQLVWLLENIDSLIEVTRKIASKRTISILHAAISLACNLFEGSRRALIAEIEAREMIVYRWKKVPFEIVREFRDEHGSNFVILIDPTALFRLEESEPLQYSVGINRISKILAIRPEYRSGMIIRPAEYSCYPSVILTWLNSDIRPIASHYNQESCELALASGGRS